MTSERWRKISALFDAAVGCDAGTRSSFLDEACAGDRDLRVEVEALLEAHHVAGPFGQHPVRGLRDNARVLDEGTTLGPYQIQSLVGAGGMGEVYKAADVRLGRTVAIKVLPEHVATDEQLKQRFEREARTVASLSHPHICSLFDVGERDGLHFLVMEYLEGQTLADRLKSGALPLAQTLRYGIQIADALDKAHRRGIVHRDVKPANIMLTATGAKLLDFGLAKPYDGGGTGGGDDSERSPGAALTGHGKLVGTLQYMAPEQVQSRETDGRTDIFALGAVLHEMVTGARAFDSGDRTGVIDAILRADVPPPSALAPATPAAVDRAIRRCLEKDPEERWQSAGDLRHELQSIATDSGAEARSAPSTAGRPRLRGRERIVWAAALLIVAVFGTWMAVAYSRNRDLTASQVIRFPINLAGGLRLDSRPTSVPIAISPRGSHIVFSAIDVNDNVQLYVREPDRMEVRPLPGTEGGFAPFFSPDGTWIGFVSSGSLKKVPLAGGPAVTIADRIADTQFGGGAWGQDGTIVFAPTRVAGLSRIPATGGTPTALTVPDAAKGEVSHLLPQFLPGDRAVLFTVRAGLNAAASRIEVLRLDTGERRVVAASGINARYSASGDVVFGGDGLLAGSLWAVPFDIKSLRPTGPEVRVGDSLTATAGLVYFTLAERGTLVSVPRGESAPQELVWIDSANQINTLADTPGTFLNPRLSPDGKRVAVTIMSQGDPRSGVWILDRDRPKSPLLFSNQSRNDHLPVWTPDGTRIVFSSLRDGSDRGAPANLYWKRLDDPGEAERLTRSTGHQDPASWSADGRFLVFAEQDQTTLWDIWMLDIKERTTRLLLRTPAREIHPMVSPDGKWLAYTSDETGKFEVYVVSFPGAERKQRISTSGGDQPLWARDGRRLFYREADKVIAVAVSPGPPFAAGKSEVVVQGSYSGRGGNGAPNYDLSADGRTFLLIRQNDPTSAGRTQLDVVVNWTTELGRRVLAKQ